MSRSAVVPRAKANRLQEKSAQELVDATETFIFDCDGVIWKGDSLIEGVPETLDLLRSMGKRLIFVTNNSTKSRAGYTKKFESLGLKVNAEEIFSSSFAAAAGSWEACDESSSRAVSSPAARRASERRASWRNSTASASSTLVVNRTLASKSRWRVVS